MSLWKKLTGGGDPAFKAVSAPTYRNGAVIERIEREAGVDHDTAVAWFNEMLIFLDLCAASDKTLSPPKPVDAAWHAFLLHTKDYESYCQERFGKVIHHQPTGKPDPKAYHRAHAARRAYMHRGGADPLIWALPAGIAADNALQTSGAADIGGAAAATTDAGIADAGSSVGDAFASSDSGGGGSSDSGGGGGSDSGGGGSSDSGGSSCSSGSSCGGGGSSCGGGG